MLTPTADGILTRRIHPDSIRWSIFAGCALILVGLLAILAPLLAGVALEAIIAWLLILGGISHLFLAWHVRGAGAHTWEVLIGLAYLLAGGYLFFHPLAGLIGLTAILGAYLLIKGIFELIAGFAIRAIPGGRWLLLDGAINLILGIIIWRQFPYAASWIVGTLIGLAVLFSGISRLALALAARRSVPAVI
jgi:uncharacterized membrane protein HdeD (DUF308 family)